MVCSKCNGKVRVADTFQTNNNETYRRKKCEDCSYNFYTIEFEVEYSEELEKELYDTPRRVKNRKARPIAEEKKRRIRDLRRQAFGKICPDCSDYICDGLDEDCPKIQRWVEKQMKKENK